MTAGRWLATAAVLVTLAIASAFAGSSLAQPRGSTIAAALSKPPSGVIADCAKGSGIGRGGSLNKVFGSRRNLVVGPLAISGAAEIPGFYSESFGGNKLPVYVKAGHRVTLALTRGTQGRAALAYGPLPSGDVNLPDAHRVITFIACPRGQFSPGLGGPAGRLTFWSGGVLAIAPRCVPVLVWVDDEPASRRAVIHLGASSCG